MQPRKSVYVICIMIMLLLVLMVIPLLPFQFTGRRSSRRQRSKNSTPKTQ